MVGNWRYMLSEGRQTLEHEGRSDKDNKRTTTTRISLQIPSFLAIFKTIIAQVLIITANVDEGYSPEDAPNPSYDDGAHQKL
ncbi:hypothetical protein TNCV_4966541 [Trichonephila clavipes]|nr:hypothetical protein TNCV_4966541 [Trichonephila clavipes]